MTDENVVENPVINEPRQPTLEEIKVIRAQILKMSQGNYKRFIESLRELPIHPQALHQAFLFFDTAALWMKEAIEFAPLIERVPEPSKPKDTIQ